MRQLPRDRIAGLYEDEKDALVKEASLPIGACAICYPCPYDRKTLPNQSGYDKRLVLHKRSKKK